MELPILLFLRLWDERSHHPRMQVPPLAVDDLVYVLKSYPELRVAVCNANLPSEGAALAPILADRAQTLLTTAYKSLKLAQTVERVGAEHRLSLSTSYRAHPDLVARLNAVNAELFRDGAAGVPYEPLEAGAAFDRLTRPPLEIAWIDAGAGADAEVAREREAAWIAHRIRALAQAKVPRAKQGSGRSGPLRFGDIAILFRARTSIEIYERALADVGVPYLTPDAVPFDQNVTCRPSLHCSGLSGKTVGFHSRV